MLLCEQEDDKEVIKVYQMQNLGNLFLSYIKPNYKQCERCGKLVKIKSKEGRPPKYCNACFDLIRKDKRVEYNANYYEKNKEV